MHPKPTPPPRNIVLCLDGTGNLFGFNKTNVIKLFQVCQRDEGQLVYYDPGVGTLGDAGFKTSIGRELNKVLGGAFGVGLMKNVEEAYLYLMDNYRTGDHIYLFGFSRGAYTARVLAGFINRCGLFEKGCQNLIPYAMQLFLEKSPLNPSPKELAIFHALRSSFRRTYGRRFTNAKGELTFQTPIHFLGLWDTVKSFGWPYTPPIIPGEEKNESVRTVCHAIALDEQRVFFPQMHWRRKGAGQAVREVWFAGVHQDVGGGYVEDDAGLSKIPLDWMLGHARDAGLRIVEEEYAYVVRGAKDAGGSRRDNKQPDCLAAQHVSLQGPWRVAEALPWRGADAKIRWRPRLNHERARRLPACAVLHRSVVLRTLQPVAALAKKQPAINQPYRATQLPALSADDRQKLAADQPLLIAGTGAAPARLLLPLDTAAQRRDHWAGEILMLALSERDYLFLAPTWREDHDDVVHRLAQRCTRALEETLPRQSDLPKMDAFHASAQAVLDAFAPPAGAAQPADLRASVGQLTTLMNAKSLDPAQRLAMAHACGALIEALVTVAARSPRRLSCVTA